MSTLKLKHEITFESLARENTGSHMLDSGGAYGYKYQQPVNTKAEKFDIHNGKIDGISLSTTEFLKSHLEIDVDLTAKLTKLSVKHDHPYFSDLGDLFAASLGSTVRCYENTYNCETDLDQNFEYIVISNDECWYEGGDSVYMLVRTHNGCDIRGGYSNPVVCRLESSYFSDQVGETRIEWGFDANGVLLTDSQIEALDRKWDIGYSRYPTSEFLKDVESFISVTEQSAHVKLKTGETVIVYPTSRIGCS